MSQNQFFEDETFVLCRQPSGGFITVPDDPQRHPLLTRLHGDDPSNVNTVLDLSEPDLLANLNDIAPDNRVQVRLIGETPAGDKRVALSDLRRIEREGALDLQQSVAEAGYALPAQLLRDGRIVLPWTSDDDALLRVSEASSVASDVSRVSEAVEAVRAAFPDLDQTFCNLQELLAKSGEDSPYAFGRSLYKATACGPWTSFIVPGHGKRGSVYYDSPDARATPAQWWSQCIGIDVGSIVEGSDVEIQPVGLLFPFTQEQLEQAVKRIDEAAGLYWERDNSLFYEVKSRDGTVQILARWTNFQSAPTVDEFVGYIEDDQALAFATTAGAWLQAHSAPDYETWLDVEGTDLLVRERPPLDPF